MKIYTKTGDQGTTSLFTGERRSKTDLVFQALGTTDELNAHLGLCRVNLPFEDISGMLSEIQCRLLDLGSSIATPRPTEPSPLVEAKLRKVEFSEAHTLRVEEWIDTLESELPQLKNFILPGGCESSARLHVARTVCRRAEREIIALGSADQSVLIYINRLSDLLFVMARTANVRGNFIEEPYQKNSSET